MNMHKLFSRAAALGTLLAIAMTAHADDVQDANKLFKQGRYAPAMEKVDAFLANNPKDAQARFLKGLILTEQGSTADAIKVFTSITEDYPELPEPYNNVAVLYAGQGEYDKATRALEMAIRTNPNYATAHENLGDLYAQKANQSYEHALQLNKGNAGLKAKLSLIRDLLARNSRAATKPVAPAAAASAPAAVTPPAAVPGARPDK